VDGAFKNWFPASLRIAGPKKLNGENRSGGRLGK
jgi:hypothetical protein